MVKGKNREEKKGSFGFSYFIKAAAMKKSIF